VIPAFEEVMGVRAAFSGLEPPAANAVSISGTDPVFSTRFRIGETCAAVLAGVGVAVCDLWQLKTGRPQRLAIDVRHAAAGLRSSVYLQRPGPDGAFKPVINKHHQAMIAAECREVGDVAVEDVLERIPVQEADVVGLMKGIDQDLPVHGLGHDAPVVELPAGKAVAGELGS